MRCLLYSEETEQHTEATFPATGTEIQDICEKLGIKNTATAEATVESVNYLNYKLEEEGDQIFCGKNFVLDEINFSPQALPSVVTKQLSLLTSNEVETFAILFIKIRS